MKFLPLILRNLLRRKVRTIFTILSIVIAFLLFGVLMAIRAAFSMGVDVAGADRLMVIHRVSIIHRCPRATARGSGHAGLTDITHANGSAALPGPQHFMANMAVSRELACGCTRSSKSPRTRKSLDRQRHRRLSSAPTPPRSSAGRSSTTCR